MKLRIVSWVAMALLAAASAAAQQGTPSCAGGSSTPQGAVLPGVTVTVRNQATGMFRETVTSADGAFIASSLVPGTYEVDRRTAGIQEVRTQGFAARGRQDGQHRCDNARSAASRRRSNVFGESPIVDVTSKEVGGNITSETLDEAAERQWQLRRLRRPAAGHRALGQHRVVRQRLDSASTAPIRATTTTCSTAATTTTTSSGSGRARRRGPRSKPSRSSRSSPISSTPSTAARPAPW